MFSFKLYISGTSKRNLELTSSLEKELDSFLKDQYQLNVINLLKNSHSALQDNVLVTPTLIKFEPEPTLRFVGNFTDTNVLKKLLFQ
ncbi:MAG: circadian clock protein KaiB [Deltaproteobacteria bacterium]|nr:circadian clock protein KaiB [Candidatus Desulfobacula maris]